MQLQEENIDEIIRRMEQIGKEEKRKATVSSANDTEQIRKVEKYERTDVNKNDDDER